MTMRAQPAMSPVHSARVAEAMTLSDSAFCKRYRSSYETPSSSSSPTLLEDTEEDEDDESSDADDERERKRDSQGLDDEGQGLDDEGHGLEDEGHGLENEGPGLEEEAAPKGQQQAVPVVDTATSEPLGLGYGAARRRALKSTEEIAHSTYDVGQSSMSVPIIPASHKSDEDRFWQNITVIINL
nr:hypothetical protein [Tanacetum cinerariifolium]GEZ45055.1 hypothetical protein [Tanacetum cinerariifolium]